LGGKLPEEMTNIQGGGGIIYSLPTPLTNTVLESVDIQAVGNLNIPVPDIDIAQFETKAISCCGCLSFFIKHAR
jgi:hypothetical protein